MTKLRGILALMATALLVAGLSVSVLSGPAGAQKKPSLSPVTVSPGVVKLGGTVKVSISKFPPNTKVAFVQCEAKTHACNIGRPVFKTTNAAGKATATFKTFAWKSCQKGKACAIGVGAMEGDTPAAGKGVFTFAR